MRVTFIGLGRMGVPMCRQLIQAGYDVTVHNRTREKEGPLVEMGATAAATPLEAAASSDVVLACLPSLDATRQVFLGEEGIARHARSGQVLVDHSTIAPTLAQEIEALAASRGAGFLDAPISGGPAGAEAGTLAIMVGGDPAHFESVRPLFEVMGGNVRRVGPAGSGSVVKLVNQLLTFVHATAAAEAFLLGAASGSPPDELIPILKTAWGQSAMLERGATKYQARDFEPGAALRLVEKDMGLVRELAKSHGVRLPLVETVAERVRAALDLGLEEEDLVAVLKPYERETDITVGG